MTKNNGGAAFPVIPPADEHGHSPSGYPYPDSGMTLRDYFAGRALSGMLASVHHVRPDDGDFAGTAYRHADAMIDARNK